jgi:hypothetical protein
LSDLIAPVALLNTTMKVFVEKLCPMRRAPSLLNWTPNIAPNFEVKYLAQYT